MTNSTPAAPEAAAPVDPNNPAKGAGAAVTLPQPKNIDRETLLSEVSEMIAAGIGDDLSSDEIADNILLTIDLMQRGVRVDSPAESANRAAIIKREFDEYFQLAEARIAQQGRMLATVRNALRPFANIALVRDDDESGPDMIYGVDLAITPAQIRTARDALEDRGSHSQPDHENEGKDQ